MNEVESISNRFDETIFRARQPSGLTVLLNPKPGFCRCVGMLGTQFGSLDREIPAPGGAEIVPDGVAHFLEHKLFEDEQGDVSLRFSARGASSNAGTEYSKTSYHFSCVDRVEDNVETLLEFVLTPYFTPESVLKEQGIIAQEIRMYDDDPDWVIYQQLLEALYHVHPVRINIAGSVESIRGITPEVLFACHRHYYHPENLVLSISGGFDVGAVLGRIDTVMKRFPVTPGQRHRRRPVPEPAGVLRPRVERRFSIARPQVCIGYKDSEIDLDRILQLRMDFERQMLLEVLFSSSSGFHRELYEKGVIDDSFDAGHSGDAEYSFTVIGGETDDPERFVSEILMVIERARDAGLEPAAVDRIRHRLLGRFMRGFNSPDSIAGALINCEFRGITLDAMLELMDAVSTADLERCLREHFDDQRRAVSVLWPGGSPAHATDDDTLVDVLPDGP